MKLHEYQAKEILEDRSVDPQDFLLPGGALNLRKLSEMPRHQVHARDASKLCMHLTS